MSKSSRYRLSDADRVFLTPGQQQQIMYCKDHFEWGRRAHDQDVMREAHAEAEYIRRLAGYSGGDDGSQYINIGGY